jgi:hypothetical protein
MDELHDIPWYRQFWPWFIIALPTAAVLAGFATLYLAGSVPAMVVDDYGQIAKVTMRRAERMQRAAELGLDAQLAISGRPDTANGEIAITLTRQDDSGAWPESLVLQLIHPTRAEQDLMIALDGSLGYYSAPFTRPTGRFYVALTDVAGTWRMTGELERGADSLRLVAE